MYYDQFWKDKSSQTGKLFIKNNLENHKNNKKKKNLTEEIGLFWI